ncbi:MAG: 2-oxoacid:acceptor oxidoreductase subunit alpha [Deltaproteobacteria bacterium]|nr:2-oxoacid:acceptor oxidoreductase subunit alpha [Deltaproteobacteria bacterium]MBW2238369.1 2-oxoacid:acceptor oxidoreductase subunit alpha [Deltaproteobacteria bacterium]MBW2670329.1 2-oxoacid:acceptor oxidoreductase subunit alpha [Deltaproteobacteria bacterium]MBW2711223.1 2-oxoacid:acceptor oxidoreductase subunit alpha [Deltaproteobacteria bacterium]
MKEISILVGGKAGDGIRQAGHVIARLLNRIGYRIFFYDDYPSLIRGGHNFSIIRAAEKRIVAHKETVDVIVALNQDAVENHKHRLNTGGIILFDSKKADAEGIGSDFMDIVKKFGGKPIMRNTAAIGALAGVLNIEWSVLEKVIMDAVEKDVDLNLKIAQHAYDRIEDPSKSVPKLNQEPLPLVSGNEAIALGAVKAGLNMYIAYPMTPASAILHYLAANENELGVVTVHPESEIGVALMALGAAYAGARAMVGTSGGGFALMTEALSLAGQGELPLVIVEAQRPGPSTGVPTYTMQGDLAFVIHAGHGEILRVVLAPGDADEAFYTAGLAMNLAWKFQIPTFVLSDKHLSESIFSFEADLDKIKPEKPLLWNNQGEYKRYLDTQNGISPLAFPGNPSAIVKATSYEHDESGITIEEPEAISRMQRKRLRKRKALEDELEKYEAVKVYGNPDSKTALLCWGSTKGACIEVAEALDLKVVQPLILEPLPVEALKKALSGVDKIIDVEVNATGQLAKLVAGHGFCIDHMILRFDGRPFTVDVLLDNVKEVLT